MSIGKTLQSYLTFHCETFTGNRERAYIKLKLYCFDSIIIFYSKIYKQAGTCEFILTFGIWELFLESTLYAGEGTRAWASWGKLRLRLLVEFSWSLFLLILSMQLL